jgi:predicted exporter
VQELLLLDPSHQQFACQAAKAAAAAVETQHTAQQLQVVLLALLLLRLLRPPVLLLLLLLSGCQAGPSAGLSVDRLDHLKQEPGAGCCQAVALMLSVPGPG